MLLHQWPENDNLQKKKELGPRPTCTDPARYPLRPPCSSPPPTPHSAAASAAFAVVIVTMNSKQLTDSLTAHIALYHAASHPNPNPNPNPRSAILRWLSSLPSSSHRQAAFTALDPPFLSLLLLMLARLRRLGPGHFFLLPDLPSPHLPELLFRRSRGLLARAAGASPSISRDILLFSSCDGQPSLSELDSITLSEALVSDINQFVSVMDGISDGQFLRGDVSISDLSSPWVELPWLKEKGYYSLEAFVANRLEVALRLSWMNANPGKKQKGARVKEMAGAAGVAANVFWRKKGCVDWWTGLEPGRRKEIFTVFLGKAAKSLVNEIAKGPSTVLKNEISFFDVEAEMPRRYGPIASWKRAQLVSNGPLDLCLDIVPVPSSGKSHFLADLFSRLIVVREISSIHLACQHYANEKERIFFTTLESALSVADCILRKLRGLLMVVSTDYISLELLGDSKSKTFNKEKKKVGCRKGKNKCSNSKKLNTVTKPSKDHGCRGDCEKDTSPKPSPHRNNLYVAPNQETSAADTSSLLKDLEYEKSEVKHEMGNGLGLADCKGHTDKKKSRRKGAKVRTDSSKKLGHPELKKNGTAILSVAAECEVAISVGLSDPLTVQLTPNDMSMKDNLAKVPTFCDASDVPDIMDGIELTESPQVLLSVSDSCDERFPCSGKSEDSQIFKHVSLSATQDVEIPRTKSLTDIVDTCDRLMGHNNGSPTRCSTTMSTNKAISPNVPTWERKDTMISSELGNQTSRHTSESSKLRVAHSKWFLAPMAANVTNQGTSMGLTSYEWPSVAPLNFISASSQHRPATADRLHLDVGRKGPSHFHQPFLSSRPQMRNLSLEGAQTHLTSPALPMSFDWPPMVKSGSRLGQSVSLRYDSGCARGLQSPFCSGFAAHGMQINGTSENEIHHYGDVIDAYDMQTAPVPPELADDAESYWWSEEESDPHAFSERDYNQFFGGGVMYWNPGEHAGTGFSRPPSHSSEDSSWAWREADLNRAIDDMVGLSGMPASYSTNGLASPPAATFCSPFDPMGPGHQTVGYAMQGNDGSGKILHSSSSASDVPEEKNPRHANGSPSVVEGVNGDQLPYPRLRPIIVPGMSRRGSRSEFKLGHDHKSSCIPSARSQPPRIKRPPSPVVLCVPPVPRPPPPSPVGISRKRGFPIVRSGSSSPRHWGMRSQEDSNPETCLYLDVAEVVWPSWGNKGFSAPLMQSIQGSLLQDHLIKISQLARDQGHPDVALPVQPPEVSDCPSQKTSLSMMHNLLHEEIETFCKQVAAKNLIKKPYINWAVRRVTRALQVLWPRSRINIFGSNATGLALPTSDVDLVISLPPVRNLEPIKEAGILEGRNGIKETSLQHAARYLANQEWVRNDSLKIIENTAIPVIMLLVEVPHDLKFKNGSLPIVDAPQSQPTKVAEEQVSASYSDLVCSENSPLPMYPEIGKDCAPDVKYLEAKSVRLDISFKSPSHTGLQTSELVRELTQQFPATVPLALVLKKFLADRSLDHSYSGGLSSYCLMLLITRFLQHEHHIGRSINQSLGSLLMDFLYFFGNVFDPRQMRISIQGSGVYMNRERGLSIDPIHIDDPLYPTNNVGRNCFRIHQCIKAFADAYSVLESELSQFSGDGGASISVPIRLLPKIIPSIDCEE